MLLIFDTSIALSTLSQGKRPVQMITTATVAVLLGVQFHYIIIIIHAFIMRAHSVVVLNQRRWQSLGGQHGKDVDGLFENVSFQMALKVSKVGESLILRGSPFPDRRSQLTKRSFTKLQHLEENLIS